MNIHHVHQQDENHFIKCSNPACDVTINRMRKYYLLRTKENKVMEMYEQAIKSHDNILKRRQSIDVSHLSIPPTDANYENFLNNFSLSPNESPKHRRFSVPNKRKGLETAKLNSSLGDLGPLKETTNDGSCLDKETSITESPPQATRSLPLHSSPKDMNNKHHPIERRAMSMINLSTHHTTTTNNNKDNCKDLSTPQKNYRDFRSISSPLHPRHYEARKRFDERKLMIDSLEIDIKKVDRLLSRMKVRSMPVLAQPNLTEIEINLDEPARDIITPPVRCLSSES